MSEAIETESAAEFIRPGSEQDQIRGPIPAAKDMALQDINPVWNRLFAENRMLEYLDAHTPKTVAFNVQKHPTISLAKNTLQKERNCSKPFGPCRRSSIDALRISYPHRAYAALDRPKYWGTDRRNPKTCSPPCERVS